MTVSGGWDCGLPPEGGESGDSGVHQLLEGVGSLPCGPPRWENPCPVCDCEGEDDLLESGPILACWFLWKNRSQSKTRQLCCDALLESVSSSAASLPPCGEKAQGRLVSVFSLLASL